MWWLVLVAALCGSHANVIHRGDVEEAVKNANAALEGKPAMETAFHAAQILASADASHLLPHAACNHVDQWTPSGSVVELNQWLQTRMLLQCASWVSDPGSSADETIASTVEAGSATVIDLAAALESAVTLSRAGVQLKKASVSKAMDALLALQGADGLFLSSTGRSSLESTAPAVRAVAMAAAQVDSVAKSATLRSAVERFSGIGRLATRSEDDSAHWGSDHPLETTTMLLSGLEQLWSLTKVTPALSTEQLHALTTFLLRVKNVLGAPEQLAAAAHVLSAAKVLRDEAAQVPVVVRTHPSSWSECGEDVVVRVTTVMDSAIGAADVVVRSVAKQPQMEPQAVDTRLEPQKGARVGEYVWRAKGASAIATPGRFELGLIVQSKEKKGNFVTQDEYEVSLKRTESLRFDRAVVRKAPRDVSSRGGEDGDASDSSSNGGGQGMELAYPKTLQNVLVVGESEQLQVEFVLTFASGKSDSSKRPFRPRQTFVRLTPIATAEEASSAPLSALFVAKAVKSEDRSSERKFRMSVSVGDRQALHHAANGGRFAMEVLVGDGLLTHPLQWGLGTVQLHPPGPPAPPPEILYSKPLLHESETTLKPLHTIEHQFQPAEKQPPAVVSLLFAGLVVAVLLAFTGAALSLGLTPRANLPFVWYAGFLGGLLGVGITFGAYFFVLPTIVHAFGWLLVSAVPSVICGHRLLVALATEDAHVKTKQE